MRQDEFFLVISGDRHQGLGAVSLVSAVDFLYGLYFLICVLRAFFFPVGKTWQFLPHNDSGLLDKDFTRIAPDYFVSCDILSQHKVVYIWNIS